MSICEHLIGSCDSYESVSKKMPEEKLNIQNELIWGLTYRNYKENEKNKPIGPMRSPIDIPFEICRAELMLKKKKSLKAGFSKVDQARGDGGRRESSEVKDKAKIKKPKKSILEKPTLLDRSIWSQSKYMDYLSIPNPKFEEPKRKKYKKRCELEPCPPRFVQLAVPNKRKVFANWKEYANFLPAEMLMRYEEILHTDQNLEPREARYYYKKLDRQKRKELKIKRRLEKKKKQEKEKDSNWQKSQIDMLAKDIVDYIQDEPLFALNYKQMLLSDGILERLERSNIMKKPSRKTKNHYKKTIIEVADKFAVWIDTLTRFVDVQAVESDEDIPPLSISSLSAEEEGEGSSEYESSTEEELRDDQLFGSEEAIWGEEGGEYDEDVIAETAENIFKGVFNAGEEGGAGLEDMFGDLDEDALAKLIQILSNCSEDFLQSEIDTVSMPGVTYMDVLNKLKELKECLTNEAVSKPVLEQIMIDWALKNDPDKVNDAVLKKIHEVSCILGDWLHSDKHGHGDDDWAKMPSLDEAEGHMFGDEDLGGQGVGGTEDHEPDTEGEETDVSEIGEEATEGESGVFEGGELGGEMGEGEGGEVGEAGEIGEGEEGDLKPEDQAASHETFMDYATPLEAEGGITLPGEEIFSDLEGEEGFVPEFVPEVVGPGEEPLEEREEHVSVIYEPELEGVEEGARLDGRVIKGHKPSKVFEHSPNTVCCLSLKTWAVWLLEITHNAHNWTQWMSCVIQKVREYASIVRGDVKLENGESKVLRKAEWRKFIKETEENIIAWRQYSAHVKDLSQSIVENFHGKEVNCCPKCLQDHLIKNVVVAHDTLQALTEAISCAAYWQRSLDTLVERTCGLAQPEKGTDDGLEVSSEESDEDVDLEELENQAEESGESVYEIEGIESNINDESPENK